MFESLFAKKVDKNKLIEIIEKASEKYHVVVTFKCNGDVEIFVGSEREEDEAHDNKEN